MSRREMTAEGKANIRAAAQKARTCPHCGHTGKGPQMFRFHMDKCPKRPATGGQVPELGQAVTNG